MNRIYTIKFAETHLAQALSALADLPYKNVATIIASIDAQVRAQRAAEIAAAETKPFDPHPNGAATEAEVKTTAAE